MYTFRVGLVPSMAGKLSFVDVEADGVTITERGQLYFWVRQHKNEAAERFWVGTVPPKGALLVPSSLDAAHLVAGFREWTGFKKMTDEDIAREKAIEEAEDAEIEKGKLKEAENAKLHEQRMAEYNERMAKKNADQGQACNSGQG